MSAILAWSSSHVCCTFNEHFATLGGDPFKSSTLVGASDTDNSDTTDMRWRIVFQVDIREALKLVIFICNI